MRKLMVTTLALLGSAPAFGQAVPGLHARTVPASKKVTDYASGVAKALGLKATAPVSRRYPKQAIAKASTFGAKGAQVQAKEIQLTFEGLTVRRIFCRTAEQARTWAAIERAKVGLRGKVDADVNTRHVISLRGRHVLVLEGKRLKTTTFLRLAFHHGWTQLPCKTKTLDLIAVDAGEASVTRSWRSKLLERFAGRALARISTLRPNPKGKTRTVITWHGKRSVQVDVRAEDRRSDVFVDARAGVRIATGPTDDLRRADLLVRTLFLDHTRRLHPSRQPHPLTPEPTVSVRADIRGSRHRD